MHQHFESINLQWDSVAVIVSTLEDALGHATNPRMMKHSVVVGGADGLQRYYDLLIVPLLDTVERDGYDDILDLFKDTCRALGRKCANYIKVCLWKPPQRTWRISPFFFPDGSRTRIQGKGVETS